MKHIVLIATFAGLLFLGACTTPEQRAAQAAAQRAMDEQECIRLGFTMGTEAFADCLLRLKEIRAREAETRALNNARRDPFWPWYRPYRRYPYYPYPYRY